jgi:hypothetical protein
MLPSPAGAQNGGEQGRSLGEIAREQRSKRGAQKPVKVYTNDDFPSHRAGAAPEGEAETASTAARNEQPDVRTVPKASGARSAMHGEAFFRERMKQLREGLESDRARLVELRKEMDVHRADVPYNSVGGVRKANQSSQWTTNPVGAFSSWQAEDKRLRESLDSQEKKIADDQKAIADFVEQCRRENCLPGWIR